MTRRARRRSPAASLFVALTLSLCALTSAEAAVPRAPVAWGVYVPGAPTNLAGVRSLGRSAGKAPGIVMWYPTWGGPYADVRYVLADVDAVLDSGAVPMLSWMTWDPHRKDAASARAYANTAIAAGAKDAYITSFARGLRSAGGPVLIRLDHEMNGIWYPWSPGQGSSTTTDFIAMWRHVHDVFVREGATNVTWVWSPNVQCGGCTPMADLYPGDAYVDWIALDGYNFGATDDHRWQTFDQVYSRSYDEILRITKKPLMLAEIGTVERGPRPGQTKSAWIADALDAIRSRYPAIRAFVWFEQDNGSGQDFRLRSPTAPANLDALRTGLSSPVFVTGVQADQR